MEEKFDILIKSVNDLKASNNKIITSINALTEKLANLTHKVNDHSTKLNNLSTQYDTLKTKVETIEIKIESSKSNSPINNELISEMIDRQQRLNNALLFNLPETLNSSNNASSDFTTVKNILDILKLETKPISATRLGKPSSCNTTKPRPLKIRFSDQKDIFELFSCQH